MEGLEMNVKTMIALIAQSEIVEDISKAVTLVKKLVGASTSVEELDRTYWLMLELVGSRYSVHCQTLDMIDMAATLEAHSAQLECSCWRHPNWVLPSLEIDPVLLHRANGPLLLALNHAVFNRMRTCLPREVRDIIWTHFWDDETFESTSMYMRQMLSGCKQCKPPHDLCVYHTQLPHFLQPDLVGHEMVREVVECWYNVSKAHEKTPHALDLHEVPEFIYRDAFGVGVDPTQFLRCLHISFRLEDLVPPATENETCSTTQIKSVTEQRELITKPLLAIKKKMGFHLSISFAQTQIRLNLWQHVIDTFGELVKVFLNEGATVETSFEYQYFGDIQHRMVYNFSALKDPERDWKSEAKNWLDEQDDIEPEHRAYLDEHLPTFDPEDSRYFTEEENDARWEADNNDWEELPEEYSIHHNLLQYIKTGISKPGKDI